MATRPRRRDASVAVFVAALGMALLASFASPRRAHAQLRADVSASAGMQSRLFGSTRAGADVDEPGRSPRVGPELGLHAHVAVLPLLRLGPYAFGALSPRGDAPARLLAGGGLEARVLAPFWVAAVVRPYLGVGFGWAGIRAPARDGSEARAALGGRTASSAGGGFFELPVAVGATWKLRKPWFVGLEVGLRWAFGHAGSLYDEGRRLSPSAPGAPDALRPAGVDRLGLGASLAVGVEL